MANTQAQTLIILIHGGASSSRSYNNVIPLLESESCAVVAPDLPGHGKLNQVPFTFEAANETIGACILENTSTSPSGNLLRPKVLLVGISLGGQAVLSFLQYNPSMVDAAIVSGVSIHPPDEAVSWEMPHMPSDQAVIDMMMEDVTAAGYERMPDLQAKSLGFTFESANNSTKQGEKKMPPVLVMIGEHDMALQRRDFDELVEICESENERSEGLVWKGAWHNHNIDVPEQFAEAVKEWGNKIF